MNCSCTAFIYCSIVASLTLACGTDRPDNNAADSESDSSEETDSLDDAENYRNLSERLFAVDRVMNVEIEMAESDWNTMRYQPPDIGHFADETCPSGPRSSPYDWFLATATVDGQQFEGIEIRKKGLLGSMMPTRPSLKLRFDGERPRGIEHMTLNNAAQDPTYAHECLSYSLFRKAGLPAPRCGLAKVTVNGTLLGIYTHIEEIKKPLLRGYFGDDSADGNLFEITTADFTDRLLVMFEPKGGDSGGADPSILNSVSDALKSDDAQLMPALERLINMDLFYTFWAMEVITAHWDGYSGQRNNSFVYHNPKDGLLYFIPWGADNSFSEPVDFFGQYSGAYDTMPWSVFAHGALCRRLISHPEGKRRYEETLMALLDSVWDEDALFNMIETIQSTLKPHLSGSIKWISAAAILDLAALIENHRQDMLNEMDGDWPSWDRPENPPHCATVEAAYRGLLTTPVESLATDLTQTGDGTIVRQTADETTTPALLRGQIGSYSNQFDDEYIALRIAIGPRQDGRFIVVVTSFPQELFVEGNTVLLDYGQAQSEVLWTDIETGETGALGFVATGQITFDRIDENKGGTVDVSFTLPVGVFEF